MSNCNEQMFGVDKILKMKKDKKSGVTHYLIKWVGFSNSDATWEPVSNLGSLKEMIDHFHNNSKKKSNECLDLIQNETQEKKLIEPVQENQGSIHLRNSGQSIEDKSTIENSALQFSGKKRKNEEKQRSFDKENESSICDDKNEHPGNLRCDVPARVVSGKYDQGKIYCKVEWNARYDGTVPENSYMETSILSEFYPKLLIQFYESKLKVIE